LAGGFGFVGLMGLGVGLGLGVGVGLGLGLGVGLGLGLRLGLDEPAAGAAGFPSNANAPPDPSNTTDNTIGSVHERFLGGAIVAVAISGARASTTGATVMFG
jgi:hypothetical protein